MGRGSLVVLGAMVLGGCAAPLRPLVAGSGPDAASGFLALDYTTDKDAGAFFQLVDDKGATRDLILRTGVRAAGSDRETAVYSVPPGVYQLTRWQTVTAPRHGKAFPAGIPLTRRFVVQPGRVVYVGEFKMSVEILDADGFSYRWRVTVHSKAIPADEALARTRTAYPAFAGAPVECLVCAPPAAGAAEFARPAQAPAGAPEIVPVSAEITE